MRTSRRGRIAGAEMIGPDAEHLAHLLAWAIQAEMTVARALEMPFYHPVIEEGLAHRAPRREGQAQRGAACAPRLNGPLKRAAARALRGAALRRRARRGGFAASPASTVSISTGAMRSRS